MRGKHTLFRFVARNCFARFVRKIVAAKKVAILNVLGFCTSVGRYIMQQGSCFPLKPGQTWLAGIYASLSPYISVTPLSAVSVYSKPYLWFSHQYWDLKRAIWLLMTEYTLTSRLSSSSHYQQLQRIWVVLVWFAFSQEGATIESHDTPPKKSGTIKKSNTGNRR